MNLPTELTIRQQLKHGLTPQMRYEIRILIMSRIVLVETMQQELRDNPVLEEVTDAEDPDIPLMVEPESVADSAPEYTSTGKGPVDLNWVNWVENVPEEWGWKDFPPEEDEENFSYRDLLRTPTTLAEHLLVQLMVATENDLERKAGVFLIGNLDEEGYLRCELEEAMAAAQSDRATVERILSMIQDFEPAGVGARDLRECLSLQLRVRGLEGSLVESIVSEYLPMLEVRRGTHGSDVLTDLARTLNCPAHEVRKALRVLKSLDPTPGLCFKREVPEWIVPDVSVWKVGDNYQVSLNDEGMPRLQISPVYKHLLRKGRMNDPEVQSYVKEKLKSAVELIRGIEKRRRTLSKVSNSIVKLQRAFLEHGVSHLKPLTLRHVATDVGVHRSTVCRAVAHKYIETEWGTFPLKYFFPDGLQTSSGEAVSSLSVKHRLQQLFAAEDPTNPFTDQQLVAILAAEGVELARRTVAKYRGEMEILPAVGRKCMHGAQVV